MDGASFATEFEIELVTEGTAFEACFETELE